jgi:phosphoribosyl 1,2-cyclic phosphodiesterase
MSIEMCVLGSGSAGNATLLRVDGRCMLIDAGLGPRSLARRLGHTGVGLDDINAIVLTHCDRDHFNPSWWRTLLDRQIAVYCHTAHLYHWYAGLAAMHGPHAGQRLHRANLLYEFTDQPFGIRLGEGVTANVRPLRLAHDRSGTCGFIVHNRSVRLGYATDLGQVPDWLIDALVGVDLLAIESNYDPAMQLKSARPAQLKRRIMGGKGHLSNIEALNAIVATFDRSDAPPQHVVLLHLSRQCNDPKIIRRLYSGLPEIERRLSISSQHAPTPWLRTAPVVRRLAGEQLHMFG